MAASSFGHTHTQMQTHNIGWDPWSWLEQANSIIMCIVCNANVLYKLAVSSYLLWGVKMQAASWHLKHLTKSVTLDEMWPLLSRWLLNPSQFFTLKPLLLFLFLSLHPYSTLQLFSPPFHHFNLTHFKIAPSPVLPFFQFLRPWCFSPTRNESREGGQFRRATRGRRSLCS